MFRKYVSNFVSGICTTNDVDIFIRHMNNARYVRELDFARFHYYGLTGIYAAIKKRGGGAVQGASSVRYRRTIPIFNPYKIETELVWWDESAIYVRVPNCSKPFEFQILFFRSNKSSSRLTASFERSL